MKTQNLKTVVLSVLTSTVLLSSSCKKEQEAAKLDAQTVSAIGDITNSIFDPYKFASNIEAYMNGKVAGYGYTIFHEGKVFYNGVGGGGWARKTSDAPARKHGAHERQGIASSTKFITALMTVAILEKHGVKLSDKVYPYLPTNWKPTAEFKQLDFKTILAHSGGLIKYGDDWSDLRKTVENGVIMADFKNHNRVYNNINYAMMTILLPYVEIKKSNPLVYSQVKIMEKLDPETLYKTIAGHFIEQARTEIFKPAGLQYWDIMDWRVWNNNGPMDASLGTLGYTTVNGNEKGTEKGDVRKNGGAGGLYISSWEFAKIQSEVAAGKIISTTGYKMMRDSLLGFDGAVAGKHGRYTWKNGGANNHETMIFDFGKTQVAVFANSTGSSIGNDKMILTNAYDNAWSK